jgi:hypothetical protein
MWKDVCMRLDIRSPIGKPFEKPTSAVLGEFERRWKLRLPASYKGFIRLFGAGEIGAYFNICAPGLPIDCNGSLEGLIQMTRRQHIREAFVETYRDEAFVDRMIPFADTIGGDVIVWDPKDVRDERNYEFGIYVLPNDAYSIVGIATSFLEFIEQVCLGPKFAKIAGPRWKPVQQFMPFYLP